MIKKVAILTMLVVSLALISTTFANDPEPGTADDNACHTGGNMEGKCATAWEWECGWYLANWFNNGGWTTPANDFIDWCAPESLLPPPPPAPPVATAPLPTCPNPIPNTYSPTTGIFKNGIYIFGSTNAAETISTYAGKNFTSGDIVGHATNAAGTGLVDVCLFP